jgi:hypothetical protein
MKQKIIAIAVILLFVIVGFIPCINGNRDVDVVSRSSNFVIVEEKNQRLEDFKNFIERGYSRDCGCEDSINWDFPVLCSILLFVYRIVLDNFPFLFFSHMIEFIAGKLGGCPGIP